MGYDIRDCVKAVVTSSTAKGVYLRLDDNQSAFARFSWLPVGCSVHCTIIKKATERLLTYVSIDSVSDMVA